MFCRSWSLIWVHRLAVLTSCLLIVAGPFSEATLFELLSGKDCCLPGNTWQQEDEDPRDEEEALLRSANLRSSRASAERRHSIVPLPPLLRATDSQRLSLTLTCRPGCEHAYRNGLGSPLLC